MGKLNGFVGASQQTDTGHAPDASDAEALCSKVTVTRVYPLQIISWHLDGEANLAIKSLHHVRVLLNDEHTFEEREGATAPCFGLWKQSVGE